MIPLIIGIVALLLLAAGLKMADGATFLMEGERIPYSNTGSAIAAGDVVPLATGTTGFVGIAVCDIAATTGTGDLDVCGVFTLPKTEGEAMTVGQIVYWDDSAGSVTGTSTSVNTRCGRVVTAAASAATTVQVKLNA